MAKRLNIEKTIDNTAFKTKIGSIDRLNPISLYVTGKAYISPTEDDQDYEKKVDSLRWDLNDIFRRFTRSNDFVNRTCITTLEVPSNGLKRGKNTYIWFMVFFSQNPKNKLCTNFSKIKEVMSPGVVSCLDEFKEKVLERGFTIHEKRKP